MGHDHHESESESHHSAHDEHSHDEHHGEHGHGPRFSATERRLWRHWGSDVAECADSRIAFEKCVREAVPNFYLFNWLFKLHWADRVYCAHEKHDLVHCEEERMKNTFLKHKALIEQRNMGN